MHTARIEIRTPFAEEIAGSLSPETAEQLPRTSAKLEAKRDRIVLLVETEDTVAMRAAMNSYLRWLGMAERITRDMKQN